MCCQFCFVGPCASIFCALPAFFSATFQLNNNLQFGLIKFLFASTILRPSQPFFTFLSFPLLLFLISAGDFVPVKYFAALSCGIRSNFYSKSFPLRNFADWRKMSVFQRMWKALVEQILAQTMADLHRSIVEFEPIDPVGDGWTLRTDTHKFPNYTFNYFITIVP